MATDALLRPVYRLERRDMALLPILLLEFVLVDVVAVFDVFERQDDEIA